ncbi:MAG TPA: S9 family peptidase [Vicinamibacterales bacterium]|nr:S9 family peptidase [Vicinamibacterales bacterium]
MRASLFAAALAALAAPASAQRAMTIEDLIGAVRVADPQLSPDGRAVAFVRTTTNASTGARNADIWVVAADGTSAPKLLVGGDKTENTPRWSPDGKRLAFISTRDGDANVYVADADGGNVRAVTRAAGGVQPPLVFSPDGSMLAFVSDVKQGTAPPGSVHRVTRLLYRHWDEWRENIRHHIFVAPVAGGEPRDLTPGDFDSPPGQQEDAAVAFTPDGRELVFVSNRDGADREAWSTNSDVWSVPVSGGPAKKLTSNPAADAQPAFTPDGKQMIVRAQRRAGFESDRSYLDVYDTSTWQRRTVFETPDLSVSDFRLSGDGQTIYFTASANGTDNLYSVPLAGGTPVERQRGGSIGSLTIGRGIVAFVRSTMTSPPDLHAIRLDADGRAAVQLTREHDAWMQAVQFQKPESLSVAGAGGTPIQYWLIKPPGFDASKKYPVVFLIHGGPQGAWGDAWSTRWNPSLWAAQGWVVAAPNPRGSTGFGQRFTDEISQDWGGKVMTDLDAVFNAVAKLPYVDAARQGIAGASYGGYAVNWIIGHGDRFKAAVSHDGVFNLESMALSTEELWFTEWEFGGPATSARARAQFAKWSPHLFADRIRTPTLVITNELDFRVPVDQGMQLFTALRRHGVPSEMLIFADEGHWVLKAQNSRTWHEAVFRWLRTHLSN